MHAAPFGIFHVNLHACGVRRLHCSKFSLGSATFTKQMGFKLSLYLGCAKSQNLARLREIAKINTRKIIGTPKSQNFVLANNSNIKVEPWKSRHFGLLSRPGPCRSESVLCLACSQCWRPSKRHCSWERCQSDIHSKMFAPRCFRLRMWEWLSL